LSEKRKPKKGEGKATQSPLVSSSPMDVNLLAKLVELMSSADLNTVDVRDGDRRVILKRGAVVAATPMSHAPISPPASPPGMGVNPAPAGQAGNSDETSYLRITSPMVGTFYAAPKPGEKPFVSVGSAVSEDTDVCIIEAMKTFNNIKAECNGTVARVLIQDGQPVEFGTVLFLVKPG
jgi:acetyl-CoA carboxylase biotin carboxyl carrier protein